MVNISISIILFRAIQKQICRWSLIETPSIVARAGGTASRPRTANARLNTVRRLRWTRREFHKAISETRGTTAQCLRLIKLSKWPLLFFNNHIRSSYFASVLYYSWLLLTLVEHLVSILKSLKNKDYDIPGTYLYEPNWNTGISVRNSFT